MQVCIELWVCILSKRNGTQEKILQSHSLVLANPHQLDRPGNFGFKKSEYFCVLLTMYLISSVCVCERACAVMFDSLQPLSMDFPKQEILESVSISFSRDLTDPEVISCISCLGRSILYYLYHLGK